MTTRVFVGLLILGAGLGDASAQPPMELIEARKLDEEAARLRARGQLAQSADALRKSLELRQKAFPPAQFPDGHADLAVSHRNLSVTLQDTGQLKDAVTHARQAVAMFQKLYPTADHPQGHPETAQSLLQLCRVALDLSDFREARTRAEEAHAMWNSLYPPEKFPDGHVNLAQSLNALGSVYQVLGELDRAGNALVQALAMREKLFPKSEYPNGHPDVANTLNNLASLRFRQADYHKARSDYARAVAIWEKLAPTDRLGEEHLHLALALNNFGRVLSSLGEHATALVHVNRSYELRLQFYPKERFPNGHLQLANSLEHLGIVSQRLGEHTRALAVLEQALTMRQALLPKSAFPNGHPLLISNLSGIGTLLFAMREDQRAANYQDQALQMAELVYPKAQFPDGHMTQVVAYLNRGMTYYRLRNLPASRSDYERALEMVQKLFPAAKYPQGHPTEMTLRLGLAQVVRDGGDVATALGMMKEVVDRCRGLYGVNRYPVGHLDFMLALDNLAVLQQRAGEHQQSLATAAEALAMQKRLVDREIAAAPEAQALAFIQTLPRLYDVYLSSAVLMPESAAQSYQPVWDNKGAVMRLLHNRHLASAVARQQKPDLRAKWDGLGEIRRQIGRLLLEPGADLPARNRRLAALNDEQAGLERELIRELPALQLTRDTQARAPADLVARLPAHTAFIDFVAYTHRQPSKPAQGRYLAFVLAPGQPIKRVELGDSLELGSQVNDWIEHISIGKPSAIPQQLKRLIWDKLAAELPAGTRTVWMSLEGDLARLPWAALPGSKPDTVLLEEFAFAAAPNGPWLLDRLGAPPLATASPALLAVGGIDYGPGKPYPALPQTLVEIQQVESACGAAGASLTGSDATAAAILARLPQARIAHLATHGFFDLETIQREARRAKEARDHWQFRTGGSAVVDVGIKHPLAFVGLVLAGANDPKARGILTGLDLVDLTLEGLQLCVLSACETGLGALHRDEGVIGLQRVFHIAGCPNVVASLWKVNDAATAALMVKFYHEMWVNKKPPIEALREAQLTIYRRPDLIPVLAAERGIKLEKAIESASTQAAPARKSTTPTKLWAAFVLSGVGK